MALTVESVGSLVAAASGDVSVSYPASIAADDLLLENVATKWNASSHGTPTGFTLVDADSAGDGLSESGTDSGTCVASIFSRIASGSESGTLTQPVTDASGGVLARMARISRSGGTGFSLQSTTARWTTNSTDPLDVTTDDAVDLAPGDLLWVLWGVNTDRMTGLASATFSASGITFGTPTIEYGETTLGGDMAMVVVYVPVDSGSATGAVSLTLEKAGSADGEGPLIFVRVREDAGGGGAAVSVPSGSLSLTGYAPSVVAPQVVSVPAAALTLTPYAPAVSTPLSIGVPSAAITLTGFAPLVVTPRNISVPAGSLSLTGYAPSVDVSSAGTTVTVPVATLTLTANAPTVATTAVISIPAGSLTLTGYAPEVSDGTGIPTIVSVPLGTLTLLAYAPKVSDGSAPLGPRLDEFPRLPADPYQMGQKVTDLFSKTNTRVNELSTGALFAHYNAVAAQPAAADGSWGDVVKNSRPKELGTGGSKYVIVGWVRLEDDFVPMRVLTGN